MKISVIVTTYNRPGALEQVIEGLLSQTVLPHEIIIADDGSGKETKERISLFLERSTPKVIHVWQKDKGFRAARSRNKAILAATGDYLVLLDGDCIPHIRFIEDHSDLAEPGSFFQGKRVLVNEKAESAFSFPDTISFFRLAGLALTGSLSNAHHIFHLPFFPCYEKKGLSGIRSCNMGIFRADAVAVNGFNHDFEGWGREDTEFVIRLFRYGLKRRENPFRAICYHLWHRENPRDQLKKNDQRLEIIKTQTGFYCDNGLDSLKPHQNDRTS